MQTEPERNEAQEAAVAHGEGPMLVAAGPGSGKTRVVTRRILYLIQKHKVPPDKILVITFTKAAALEMQRRFERLAGESGLAVPPVRFGTFHAIFYHILRETAYPGTIQLLTEEEKRKYLKEILHFCPFPVKGGPEVLEGICQDMLRMKNSGTPLKDYEPFLSERAVFSYACETLERRKQQEGKLEFQDMADQCLGLFLQKPGVLETWRSRFSYILVDEFQDIDEKQYRIVKLLAGESANLFMVGDDDQSIYGFRGARPDIMLRAERDFPALEKLILDVNYRSGKEIVKAAGWVIECNSRRIPKQIRAQKKGGRVEINAYADAGEETAALTARLRAAGEGEYGKNAVLFRTNRELSEFAGTLVREGVPFVMREKAVSMFRTPEALDILACVRFAAGERSRANFYRFMNKPFRAIGREEIQLGPVREEGLYRPGSLRQNAAVKKLFSDLDRIRGLPPYAAVNYIRQGMGYDVWLEEKYVGEELEEKLRLTALLTQSARGLRTLGEWEAFREELEKKLAAAQEKAGTKKDGVQLVTMHGSKGLEYDRVYIPHLNEGRIPYKKSVTEEAVEEERRMFYVAMTRAGEELILSYVSGEKERASRFLLPLLQKNQGKVIKAKGRLRVEAALPAE